eukprot:15001395-Alexandrium_andersonii.AAC.1
MARLRIAHAIQSLCQQSVCGLPIVDGRVVCTVPDPPYLPPVLAMTAYSGSCAPDPAVVAPCMVAQSSPAQRKCYEIRPPTRASAPVAQRKRHELPCCEGRSAHKTTAGAVQCPLRVATANVLSLAPAEQRSANEAGLCETGRMQ